MTELLTSQYEKQQLSRRNFLKLAGLTSIAAVSEIYGIRLNSPNLKVRVMDYKEEVANAFLGRTLVNNKDFFNPNRVLLFSHRSGNNFEDMNIAFEQKRANVFDIDANDVNGTIYGEHGFIMPQIKLFGANIRIPLVIDPSEAEVTGVMPKKIDELIKHMSSLRTKDHPIGVYIDLKRGPFEKETLEKLIDTLYEYDIPALIQPITRRQLDDIRSISEDKERETLPSAS